MMTRALAAVSLFVLFAMAGGSASAASASAACQPTTVILMHAKAEVAEVKIDGETLFSGSIELAEPALGISARREACVRRGKVLIETVQDGAARSQTVAIGRRTRFIYIDMGRNPRIDVSDKPFPLD